MPYSKSTIIYRTFFGLSFLLICMLGVFTLGVSPNTLEISFLDVGQGDAILIQTPNHKQILIDAGPKDVVISKLREVMPRGDKTIDMIVVTNPDADHISGFNRVLDEYSVSSVLVPNTRNPSETFKNLMKKIEKKQIEELVAFSGMKIVLEEGDTRQREVLLTVLFPDQVVKDWSRNDGSIVSRLSYGDTSVMLMGDATSETEKIIIGDALPDTSSAFSLGLLKSDILKLGHHGSRTSNSDVWLDTVKPKIAIVSAGENNRYGHPHKEVIERLLERDIEIRETSKEGTMTYVSDGEKWVEK